MTSRHRDIEEEDTEIYKSSFTRALDAICGDHLSYENLPVTSLTQWDLKSEGLQTGLRMGECRALQEATLSTDQREAGRVAGVDPEKVKAAQAKIAKLEEMPSKGELAAMAKRLGVSVDKLTERLQKKLEADKT